MRRLATRLGLITVIAVVGIATVATAVGASTQFSFSTTASGATFTCALDGGSAAACSSPTSYGGLSAGPHTVTMTSTFTAGSQASTTLLGTTSVRSTADSNPSNSAQAWVYTASSSGAAGSIAFYLDSPSTTAGLTLGLYSDSNGAPGTLLGSATVSAPKAGAWNTATFRGAPSVTSGTKYWLAALGTGGGMMAFRDVARGSGCSTVVSSQSNLTALPQSFSTGGVWNGYCPASFYVNGGSSASTGSVQFSFSTTASGATFTCALDGGSAAACSSPTSYGGLSAGPHTVTMTSTFTAGSQASTTLLGTTSVRSTADSNPSNSAQAWVYTASSSGAAGSIAFYLDSPSTTAGLTLGLYSDSNGAPGTLLGSATVSAPKAGAWNTATFRGAPSVTSGTKYWLAALGTGGGMMAFRDVARGSGCSTVVSSQSNLTALPQSFSTGGVWNGYCPASFYVNGGGSGPAATPPPSNTVAPAMSGSAVQGQTLTTSNGSWSNSPTSYSYQWEDCNSSGASCSNISGATSSSYTLAGSDVGHTIRSVVTAANAGGSGSANSAASAMVSASPPAAPASTAAPVLSGSAVQGQSLSTSNGSWSSSPSSYSYQWEDCNGSGASCSVISGAASSSYALGSGDVGHTVRSVVTASNAGGSGSASSAVSAVVTAAASAPASTAAPVLSGSAVQGQSLSTSNGSWANSPSSYSYQWEDCNSSGSSCSNISGATGSSYTLAGSDVGDTIRSVVTATNSAGSASASSAATGQVTASGGGGTAPVDQVAPYFCGSINPAVAANADAIGGCTTMTGSAVQGQTLSVGTGVWSPTPTSFSYQWKDCTTTAGQPPTTGSCANVANGGGGSTGTASTYTVQASDVGKALVPVVTAFNGATASTPTSVAGGCDFGETQGGTGPSQTTSYTDPAEPAGCSPISAVVGTTSGTGAGAMKFCTSAPVTCGFPDPLSGNIGVSPGTTLTSVASVTCGSGQTVQDVYTTSITVSGSCTLVNDRIIGGIDYNSCTACTFSHIESSGTYANESSATLGAARIQNVSARCNYNYSNNTSGDASAMGTPDRGGVGQTAVTANWNYIHCGSEPWNGGVGVSNSYVISDECYGPSGCYGNGTTHNEAIYQFGGDDAGTAAHPKVFTNDTIVDPWQQTAGMYQDCTSFGGGPTNYTHIDGNLFVSDGNNGSLNACPDTTGFEYLNNRQAFVYDPSASCGLLSRHTGMGDVRDSDLTDLGTQPC